MATIGQFFPDIIDALKRSESDDRIQIGEVIELLAQTNQILEDALTVQCNLGTRHRTTLRTSLPTGAWGKLYQGVPQGKSETGQVEDTTGFFETLSSVDRRLLDVVENEGALRLSEAEAHLEAVSQEVASSLIYANEDLEPEKFTGLAPRFASLSDETGGQIVDAGGTGADNTSIWFVTWGPNQTHLIHPRGTQAGVQRMDKGEQRVTDADGNAYFVAEELFRQHVGLTVRDFRFVARVANIDVSDLAAGSVDIYKFMRQAFWSIKRHNVSGGRQAIYCNADVLEALDAGSTPTNSTQSTSATVRVQPTQIEGREVMAYRGIPVRQVDAILNTEAQVT